MRKYKVEYEYDGKNDYAVVEAEDVVDARETFLSDYADIDPKVKSQRNLSIHNL